LFVEAGEAVAASREHFIAMLPRPPIRSRKGPKPGKKSGKPLGFRRTASPCLDEKEKKNSLKMRDQYGDVYENKGSAFHERGRSGNVAENKGTYTSKAGMLLKTSMLVAGGKLFSHGSSRLARDASLDPFRASAASARFQRTLDLQVGAEPLHAAPASETLK
jgi:hypothetical protein